MEVEEYIVKEATVVIQTLFLKGETIYISTEYPRFYFNSVKESVRIEYDISREESDVYYCVIKKRLHKI